VHVERAPDHARLHDRGAAHKESVKSRSLFPDPLAFAIL
jgi:hypothetical protein